MNRRFRLLLLPAAVAAFGGILHAGGETPQAAPVAVETAPGNQVGQRYVLKDWEFNPLRHPHKHRQPDFVVPPHGCIQVLVQHTHAPWFTVEVDDQWGPFGFVRHRTGPHMLRCENPTDQPRNVWVTVHDSWRDSSASDPYTLTVWILNAEAAAAIPPRGTLEPAC